jgi:hypothetical protein
MFSLNSELIHSPDSAKAATAFLKKLPPEPKGE